jgi:hypothetical protein
MRARLQGPSTEMDNPTMLKRAAFDPDPRPIHMNAIVCVFTKLQC